MRHERCAILTLHAPHSNSQILSPFPPAVRLAKSPKTFTNLYPVCAIPISLLATPPSPYRTRQDSTNTTLLFNPLRFRRHLPRTKYITVTIWRRWQLHLVTIHIHIPGLCTFQPCTARCSASGDYIRRHVRQWYMLIWRLWLRMCLWPCLSWWQR